MILVATRILRGGASQEILTPLVQVDRWIFVTDTLTGSTETYNKEHIQSPVRQGMKGIPSYICLLRYPVVFFFGTGEKLTTRQLWFPTRNSSERSSEQSSEGNGMTRFQALSKAISPLSGLTIQFNLETDIPQRLAPDCLSNVWSAWCLEDVRNAMLLNGHVVYLPTWA